MLCAFQGRVGKDPEPIRYSGNGNAMLSFSVAIDDSKRGEGDPAEWCRVTA